MKNFGMSAALAAAIIFGAAPTAALSAPKSAATTPAAKFAMKVGAAKVDITPTGDDLPKTFLGILDPLHARAIVVDDGKTRAVMVAIDAGGIMTETWKNLSARIERELKIPAANVLLTATHTHSVPYMRGANFEAKIFEAVAKAAADTKPARMAYGTGVSHINVNRNIIDRETNRWWEGSNYDGVSDKSVAVVRFESLDGKPIAIYYNYAVHAVLTGNLDLVSADLPGAASNYIEASMGDDVVAVYSNGAAGDQNPIYFQQTYDLRAIRVADYAKRGEDISNAMPPGGTGMDRSNPRVQLLMEQQKQMALSMGQMLGEEVLHVNRAKLERPTTKATITGLQTDITCPGRKRLDQGRAGYAGTYEDSDPVTLRLSLLKLGDTVIGGVNGEVFTAIGLRFKLESPYKRTMMATTTNGFAMSGYIPNDAAFGYNTFEVVSSRLKPGCAESAIVNGLLDMIDKAEAK
jgi:neutral ceramidase